jgi:hypothetical protein
LVLVVLRVVCSCAVLCCGMACSGGVVLRSLVVFLCVGLCCVRASKIS